MCSSRSEGEGIDSSSMVTLPSGDEPASVRVPPPGPRSRAWLQRSLVTSVPMGPIRNPTLGMVYAAARGANVVDADGNVYVDLAAGFGAMLLGHGHPRVLAAVREQSERLLQSLGDVYPSDLRLRLEAKLLECLDLPGYQIMWGQSGADAVTAALKTAVLVTGRPKVIAWSGAYHGLSYAPLAACGLREGYRAPFQDQLNSHVVRLEFPASPEAGEQALQAVAQELGQGDVGAILIEPILGRGGCVLPPDGFLVALAERVRQNGGLLIADEIWTGLGRTGSWLESRSQGVEADILCLGKGLGGGLPISACLARAELMRSWQRQPEVVHTSTFAGTPLACAAALATLDVLDREGLVERAAERGRWFRELLTESCGRVAPRLRVRGRGFMIGIAPGASSPSVPALLGRLLGRGHIASSGGGARDVVVLTPPLNISEARLREFAQVLAQSMGGDWA